MSLTQFLSQDTKKILCWNLSDDKVKIMLLGGRDFLFTPRIILKSSSIHFAAKVIRSKSQDIVLIFNSYYWKNIAQLVIYILQFYILH